jgi:hypothetical protein
LRQVQQGKIIMRKAAFVLLAFCLSAPAFAAPDAPTNGAKPEKPKKEKKICKKIPAPTGSWMSPTVCKTAAEWQEEQNDDAEKIGFHHG